MRGNFHKMAKPVCLFNQIQHNILWLGRINAHQFVVFGRFLLIRNDPKKLYFATFLARDVVAFAALRRTGAAADESTLAGMFASSMANREATAS